MTTTIQRIDQLSEERLRLYRIALDSLRGDQRVKQRIDEITRELDGLWDLRRRERAGRVEGIDALVERSYAQLYGDDYQDAVTPPAVEDETDAMALVA